MKHLANISLLIVIIILSNCSSGPLFNDPTSKYLYYKMTEEKVKKMSSNADFTKLRLAYTATRYYNPYDTKEDDLEKEMHSLFKNSEYKNAIVKAEQILKNNFVNIDAHHLCEIAYEKLGIQDKMHFHHYVTEGLIRSIFSSGDGKTKETAFNVIFIDEEYIILAVLSLKMKSQSLVTENNHSYDMMTVYKTETDENMDVYFNIDIPHNWLSKRFK